MFFLLVFFLIPTAESSTIYMYNLCDYSVPMWQDEIIGVTSIEVIDEDGSSFVEDDLSLIGMRNIGVIDPGGSLAFEEELSPNPTSYRIGHYANMEVRFTNLLEVFDYIELDITYGFEIPVRLQPDRSGSKGISCLEGSCFGTDVFGNSITSKAATVENGGDFAIFFCPS